MAKFAPIELNEHYELTLSESGNVVLIHVQKGIVGTMNYYYLRNDLPLLINHYEPTIDLRRLHLIMRQLDTQLDEMIACGCLEVGGQNVAIRQG